MIHFWLNLRPELNLYNRNFIYIHVLNFVLIRHSDLDVTVHYFITLNTEYWSTWRQQFCSDILCRWLFVQLRWDSIECYQRSRLCQEKWTTLDLTWISNISLIDDSYCVLIVFDWYSQGQERYNQKLLLMMSSQLQPNELLAIIMV